MAISKTKLSKPSRDVLKHSAELKKKKRIGAVIIAAVIFCVAAGGVGYLFYCPSTTIKKIEIQGNNILDKADLVEAIEQELAGKYLFIFPRDNIWLYPRKTLETKMLAVFPRLKQIDMKITDWDSLSVVVAERKLDSIWCHQQSEIADEGASTTVLAANLPSQDQCYFADPTGVVFAESPVFVGQVFVELTGGLPAEPIGQQPLSQPSYQIISRFARLLPELFVRTANDQYRLLGINILSDHDFEAVIANSRLGETANWQVLFGDKIDADALANNLYSVLESPAFRRDMVEHQGNIRVIDLRFGAKVFYRLWEDF